MLHSKWLLKSCPALPSQWKLSQPCQQIQESSTRYVTVIEHCAWCFWLCASVGPRFGDMSAV
eukprot:3770257-Alexandrium_andersonii.AAC.1